MLIQDGHPSVISVTKESVHLHLEVSHYRQGFDSCTQASKEVCADIVLFGDAANQAR